MIFGMDIRYTIIGTKGITNPVIKGFDGVVDPVFDKSL